MKTIGWEVVDELARASAAEVLELEKGRLLACGHTTSRIIVEVL